jgi:hypothetical protein
MIDIKAGNAEDFHYCQGCEEQRDLIRAGKEKAVNFINFQVHLMTIMKTGFQISLCRVCLEKVGNEIDRVLGRN